MAGPSQRRAPHGGIYKHVPRDLTYSTTVGGLMSIACILVVTVLFFSETFAFLRTTASTTLEMDESTDSQIRLNFNVTMHELDCEFAVVDVLDKIGTNRQNVTANVDKWGVDGYGRKTVFAGRAGSKKNEIKHEMQDETLEELIEDGSYSKPLTKENFDSFLSKGENHMVDFFAPWCRFCQMLAPTWEKFAQEVFDEGMPIGIGGVDCTVEKDLCSQYQISAFPSILFFHREFDGSYSHESYRGDRTVDTFIRYAKTKVTQDQNEWEQDKKRRKEQLGNVDLHKLDTRGCMLSGWVMVNRVPGNFHIEARSSAHTIDPAMANLTHTVNDLSFGDPKYVQDRRLKRLLDYELPETVRRISPYDDQKYFTDQFHQAFHHSMKVVPTEVKVHGKKIVTYQIMGQSQIVYYELVNVPEARFSYDISPMTISVEKSVRRWYQYITSICGIIGGTYTTLGLIDAVLYQVLNPKRRR